MWDSIACDTLLTQIKQKYGFELKYTPYVTLKRKKYYIKAEVNSTCNPCLKTIGRPVTPGKKIGTDQLNLTLGNLQGKFKI